MPETGRAIIIPIVDTIYNTICLEFWILAVSGTKPIPKTDMTSAFPNFPSKNAQKSSRNTLIFHAWPARQQWKCPNDNKCFLLKAALSFCGQKILTLLFLNGQIELSVRKTTWPPTIQLWDRTIRYAHSHNKKLLVKKEILLKWCNSHSKNILNNSKEYHSLIG